MEKLKHLLQEIEKEINSMKWPSKPDGLYEPLSYFLGIGGKRMRPLMSLMSAEMFGANPLDAMPAAMSVELFHNFSLIHDDIMDEAPLRRSMPTVHTKWNQNTAILSGDVMLIKSYQQLAAYKENLHELFTIFNDTAVGIWEGQQMDMNFETRDDVSIEEYLEMIRLKTSVLLGCSLKMGAVVGGADKNNADKIYSFGQDLGIAFQIKDDILDLYGDPEKFGKQIGGDIIANKKTLLYLLALEHGTAEQKAELKRLEEEKDLDKKVASVRSIFDAIGVLGMSEERMKKYETQALQALSEVSVEKERKADLESLAFYLMNRQN